MGGGQGEGGNTNKQKSVHVTLDVLTYSLNGWKTKCDKTSYNVH